MNKFDIAKTITVALGCTLPFEVDKHLGNAGFFGTLAFFSAVFLALTYFSNRNTITKTAKTTYAPEKTAK